MRREVAVQPNIREFFKVVFEQKHDFIDHTLVLAEYATGRERWDQWVYEETRHEEGNGDDGQRGAPL